MSAQKVLVIEDDALLAFEMQDVLAGAGYEVIGPAATIAKALQLIGAHDIDAAFVDCNLDCGPATAVVERLTAKKIPFVVVTGSARESLPPEFSNAAFVRKPFNTAGLLKAARRLLTGDEE